MAQQPPESCSILLSLPAELRLKIYEELFDDLIEDLSDNLFGVFQLYDNMYDYTANHLESHIGKTGLTPILFTCKQIYSEAIAVLCERSSFLVNVVAYDDIDDEERSSIRFSDGSRRLAFARDLRVNFLLSDDDTVDRFVDRVTKFRDTIHQGADLRKLQIFLEVQPEAEMKPVSLESMFRVLQALAPLKTAGAPIEVYLGDVNEEGLSDDMFTSLVDAIKG